MELDPLNSLVQGISAWVLMAMSRYDDVIVRARNVLKTSPNDSVAYNLLWQSFQMKGMYEEALTAAKAFFAAIGLAEIEEVMSRGYAEGGYSEAMRFAGDTLAELYRETYIAPQFISNLYAFAGKKDQTLEWLERGYEAKDPNMPYIIEPIYDSMRDDPRFKDLLRRMNLPELE